MKDRQMRKGQRKWHQLVEQIRTHKSSFTLYLILRGLVILTMVMQFLHGNFENVFLCILTLFLFIVPSFIEKNFHIQLPDTLETIILLFIFAAEILGEIQAFYVIFPFWDTMLHTLNGFLAAAIGAPGLCKLIDGLGGAFGLVLGMTGSCAILLLVSILSSVAAVVP